MIKLLITFLILTNLYASSQKLLKCLGQEELKFHKAKVNSPLSKLNREIISAFIQFRSSIELDAKRTAQICESKNPALSIMQEVIISPPETLFKSIYDPIKSPKEYAMDKMTLDQFESNAYTIFLNYLFAIQATLEKENCLKQKVPGLKSFFSKMQYTLEEEGMKKIFRSLKNPKLIFTILSDIESGDINCVQSKAVQ